MLIEELFEQTVGKEFPTGVDKIHSSELREFAKLIIRECCNVVAECDESSKMILHEPYRRIIAKIHEHFEE